MPEIGRREIDVALIIAVCLLPQPMMASTIMALRDGVRSVDFAVPCRLAASLIAHAGEYHGQSPDQFLPANRRERS